MLCHNVKVRVQKELFKNKSAYYTAFLLTQQGMISALKAFLNNSFHYVASFVFFLTKTEVTMCIL
jgi:hypothetical protein